MAAGRQPILQPDEVAPPQNETPALQRNTPVEPRRAPQNTPRPNGRTGDVPLNDPNVRFDPRRVQQRPTPRGEGNMRGQMAIGPGHGRGGGRGLGTHTQGRGGVPGRGVGHAPPVGVVGLRGTTLPTRGAIQTRGTTERIVPPASKTLRTTNVGSPVAVRANDAPPANTTRREGGTTTAETRLPAPGTTVNNALSQCTQHNFPTQIQQRSLNDTELNRRSIAL